MTSPLQGKHLLLAMSGGIAGYKVLNPKPEFAEVLAVKPVTETTRTPKQVCHDVVVHEQAPVRDTNRIAGTAIGAVAGGLLGHQIGEGSGKQIARIGGAVLGGLAGNEAEKRYRAVSHYRIGVRMDDGSYRVVEQQEAPAWRRGDAVRLQNGGIVAGGAAPAGSAAF